MYTNQNGETEIDIPNELLITNSEKSLLSLVDFVYPNILEQFYQNIFEEATMLALTLEVVDQVNEFVFSLIRVMRKSI